MHVVRQTADVSQLGIQQVEVPQVYFTKGLSFSFVNLIISSTLFILQFSVF